MCQFESDKRFTLHAIIGVALRTDIDGSACIQDALIQDEVTIPEL